MPHTLCPKRLVVGSCPRPGQPPQQRSQRQTSHYPSQDRILGPTPRPEGRRLAQRDRQPPGIPSTRAVCCLEGGQLIPGLGPCWAGWGSSCTSPGQRLMEAPGLGGQAAVGLFVLPGLGEGGGEHWILPTARPSLPGWPLSGLPCWAPLGPLQCPLKVQSEPSMGLQNQPGKQSCSPLFSSLRLVWGLTPNCLLQRLSSVPAGLAWPHWNL